MKQKFPLALTEKQFRNLNELEELESSENLSPIDHIDLWKNSLYKMQRNGKRKTKIEAIRRIFRQTRYKKSQIKWLTRKINKYRNKSCRYLVEIPLGVSNFDKLRDALIEIQKKAGIKRIYLPIGKDEDISSFSSYMKSRNIRKPVIVISMDSDIETISKAISEYEGEVSEICLIYKDFKENRENFNFVCNLAKSVESLFHMSFVPVTSNSFNKIDPVGTALIVSGFDSISVRDKGIPPFILQNIDRDTPPATIEKKIQNTVWIGRDAINYSEEQHPGNCICNNKGESIGKLAREYGLTPIWINHTISILGNKFREIKESEEQKKKVVSILKKTNLRNIVGSQ
ncbi:MAG: hypothetical protein ACOCRX_08475 [Candidatus Woesearchaeota archaeon]